ncbi:MAG: M1 family metallopeptidase [Bacteroidota bacterium]
MRYTQAPFLALLFLWVAASSTAQEGDSRKALSSRIASYDIGVTLDTDQQLLLGKELLHWRNPSTDTIRTLQFHLYLNAFKNNRSTFMRESDPIPNNRNENIWGWIDIDRMTDAAGNDLTSNMRFIQPDDDNQDDQTVLEVDLVKAVLPGQKIDLRIDFTAKLPRVIARTGYSKDYYLVGQWFPKIGVYEPAGMRYAKKGQWNCHQFHANSEFYADFGVYNVDITVPANYVVGASGSLQKTEEKGGFKTHSYRAEDVIDFAWTASPRHVVREDRWKDVAIKLLVQPEHLMLAERYLLSAKQSLEYFDEHLGEYPYKTLTIVDPPVHAVASSGMEYPTFITGLGLSHMPTGVRLVELVTIHEFGHQYFMQLLASNEFEEPWLDEGFNTYFECLIMDQYYGEKTSYIDFGSFFHFGDMENQRLSYTGMANPKIAENFRSAWQFRHGGYGQLTYAKAGTWMRTLQGLVGMETMEEIMKTYFERWKFKHPCADDFIDIVNEVTQKNHAGKFGPDMNWFFNQVLYGSNVCDYEIRSISNRALREDQGIFEDKSTWYQEASEQADVENYFSRVILHRTGEVTLPTEVLIHFENGEEKLEQWNGRSRTKEFNYTGPSKIEWAKIDPENKIYIDQNLNNNSRTTKPQTTAVKKYSSRFMLWMQQIMQSVTFFI